MASKIHPASIRHAMGKTRPQADTDSQIAAYRNLAREALDSVAVYNARAQWFECSDNENLAGEYRALSKEALERAQRYKELADVAEKRVMLQQFEQQRRAK
jgi:hypothetical protein